MIIAVLTVAGWLPNFIDDPYRQLKYCQQGLSNIDEQYTVPNKPEFIRETTTHVWKNPQQGDIMIEKVTGMQFVYVPEGCFQMGFSNGGSDERPVHEVCVDGYLDGEIRGYSGTVA